MSRGLGWIERAILAALAGAPGQYDGQLAREVFQIGDVSDNQIWSVQRSLRHLLSLGLLAVTRDPVLVPGRSKSGIRRVRLAKYSLPAPTCTPMTHNDPAANVSSLLEGHELHESF